MTYYKSTPDHKHYTIVQKKNMTTMVDARTKTGMFNQTVSLLTVTHLHFDGEACRNSSES